MKLFNIKDYIGGWIIGDFLPSIIRTKEFEVSVKYYKPIENATSHCHKEAEEITVIVSGMAKMNGITYSTGDIVLIEKGEYTDFIPLTDTITCCIKIPSVVGDKYEQDSNSTTI